MVGPSVVALSVVVVSSVVGVAVLLVVVIFSVVVSSVVEVAVLLVVVIFGGDSVVMGGSVYAV